MRKGVRDDWYWWSLKDRVKARGQNRCEFCERRSIHALHHRTYDRFGHEYARDVMGVCSACHKFIHGRLNKIVVNRGSLADLGDRGIGSNDIWKDYLRRMSDAR